MSASRFNPDLMSRAAALLLTAAIAWLPCGAQSKGTASPKLRYGNMDTWVTRNIHESSVIGGDTKTIYAPGPNRVINGNQPYTSFGGSPWGTSNVLAKVHGITKASCSVSPADHPGHGRCARLSSKMETVKVLGIVNIDVMVAGSMFLGHMNEPVTSTKNPYSKIDMGVPFTGRPKALRFDYKLTVPPGGERIKSTGFSSKKTIPGQDHAVAFVWLQRRWEEPDGSIHARRVASGGQRFSKTTPWKEGHTVKLVYGDPTGKPGYDAELMGIRKGDNAYFAINSKGKSVPVIEEGWDEPGAVPTHAIVMFSSGSSEAYVAQPGMDFFIDNVAFVD